jgi:hypothetical protein
VVVVAMADPRYPYWIQDMSPVHRGPTTIGVFFRLALILVLLILGGAYGPARAWADHRGEKYPTLCAEHRGRPGWSSVCPPEVRPVKATQRPTDLDGLD